MSNYAIGIITSATSVTGHPVVELHEGGDTRKWCLSNHEEMPPNHPCYGLFQFDPQDQFCRWVDPSSLGMQEVRP